MSKHPNFPRYLPEPPPHPPHPPRAADIKDPVFSYSTDRTKQADDTMSQTVLKLLKCIWITQKEVGEHLISWRKTLSFKVIY